ncbi:MAG: hypothetical protein AAF547_12600, partial [Actinomycetota bacterium]
MTTDAAGSVDDQTTFDVGPFVDEVGAMVRAAGRRSLEWYRNLDRIENKKAMAGAEGFDPVTEADRAGGGGRPGRPGGGVDPPPPPRGGVGGGGGGAGRRAQHPHSRDP